MMSVLLPCALVQISKRRAVLQPVSSGSCSSFSAGNEQVPVHGLYLQTNHILTPTPGFAELVVHTLRRAPCAVRECLCFYRHCTEFQRQAQTLAGFVYGVQLLEILCRCRSELP